MEKLKVTPKDFFLWAGAMLSLYVSVFSLLSLIFSYIDKAFPDALDYNYDPYSSGMRFAIASLIVLFPLFLVLMRLIRKDIAHTPPKADLWVRRWALVFTIFVAGVTVAGDLITLVNYFLGGDLTTRFVLKVVIVLLVIGGAFMHFLADMWGFWIQNPEKARMIGWGAGAVVLASIVSGFFIIGTPGQVRLYRFDDQKVSDLQNIQYQVVNYWQQKEKLPDALSQLSDPLSGWTVPVEPQGGSYRYEKTAQMTFKLCATFNAETQANSMTNGRAMPVSAPLAGAKGPDLETQPWTHAMGERCFERTIDPQRYPPFTKPIK